MLEKNIKKETYPTGNSTFCDLSSSKMNNTDNDKNKTGNVQCIHILHTFLVNVGRQLTNDYI